MNFDASLDSRVNMIVATALGRVCRRAQRMRIITDDSFRGVNIINTWRKKTSKTAISPGGLRNDVMACVRTITAGRLHGRRGGEIAYAWWNRGGDSSSPPKPNHNSDIPIRTPSPIGGTVFGAARGEFQPGGFRKRILQTHDINKYQWRFVNHR